MYSPTFDFIFETISPTVVLIFRAIQRTEKLLLISSPLLRDNTLIRVIRKKNDFDPLSSVNHDLRLSQDTQNLVSSRWIMSNHSNNFITI